jgi:phosphate/sulfate permease
MCRHVLNERERSSSRNQVGEVLMAVAALSAGVVPLCGHWLGTHRVGRERNVGILSSELIGLAAVQPTAVLVVTGATFVGSAIATWLLMPVPSAIHAGRNEQPCVF